MIPRMPPVVALVLAGMSAVMYMYGWIISRRNWLIHFFTTNLWISMWISYQGMAMFALHADKLPETIPPIAFGRILMIILLVLSGFLTFVNYRIALNFVQRRGNIDRDMLGRLHGDVSPWERIKKRWKRKKGLVIQLGEEVPFD